MADAARAPASNAAGNFFVDDTCIDCDLCRQIEPEVFVQEEEQSVVGAQPRAAEQRTRAAMALVACPTGSIGTRTKIDMRSAIAAFPEWIEDDVSFCGYASRHSFGARSYLIVRPEGNVLVDSPRFARSLIRRLEELGGVRTLFLTHRDDVADHARFHAHFGCERIIHAADSRGIDAERRIDGSEQVRLDPDLTVVPTPGHTRGHAVLLYREKFLFAGDHLAWSHRYGHLIAFRRANWYSWPETIRSMERLKDYRFEWVLPGHGRPARDTAEVMAENLAFCVEWMKKR
jgi:glyoxylase-like metal-dependent hydrolase (beta-lactamase superfamily II)